MISEILLRALQERMRKLTDASSTSAIRNAELRAAVERAKLTDAEETAREAAAIEKGQQLADEIRALRDHVNDLIRGHADGALIAGLEAELSELEDKRSGIIRRSEDLGSHRHQVMENATRELESAEQQYRHIADQAMRLREHIEKLVHS